MTKIARKIYCTCHSKKMDENNPRKAVWCTFEVQISILFSKLTIILIKMHQKHDSFFLMVKSRCHFNMILQPKWKKLWIFTKKRKLRMIKYRFETFRMAVEKYFLSVYKNFNFFSFFSFLKEMTATVEKFRRRCIQGWTFIKNQTLKSFLGWIKI